MRHPIEYAVKGDSDLWWQSPSLAEGLQYHAVTIDIDLKQVYQIVFILLRMGDSPRPANWILEKSIDGRVFEPWVFFAENAYQCRTLYQPLVNGTMRITSDSRPHNLGSTEVCFILTFDLCKYSKKITFVNLSGLLHNVLQSTAKPPSR